MCTQINTVDNFVLICNMAKMIKLRYKKITDNNNRANDNITYIIIYLS